MLDYLRWKIIKVLLGQRAYVANCTFFNKEELLQAKHLGCLIYTENCSLTKEHTLGLSYPVDQKKWYSC